MPTWQSIVANNFEQRVCRMVEYRSADRFQDAVVGMQNLLDSGASRNVERRRALVWLRASSGEHEGKAP